MRGGRSGFLTGYLLRRIALLFDIGLNGFSGFLLDPFQAAAGFISLALAIPQAGVDALLAEELCVGAALGDVALIEHDDLIGLDNGGQPVGDHQCRAVPRHLAKSVLDFLFGVAIERRGRFIQN